MASSGPPSAPTYDPEACGADCQRCVLRLWRDGDPVGPEGSPDATVAVVAEAPGEDETIEGRPLIGRSGMELQRALDAAGVKRTDLWLTNAIACFPGETQVLAGTVKKVFRRLYEGPGIRVTTVNGHELTGTPNHPAFTPEGRVALGALREGDSVFCRLDRGGEVESAGPNVQDRPVPIEELYRTLAKTGNGHRVVGRLVDFHGDGTEGEVEVVGSGGSLGVGVCSDLREELSEFGLELPGHPTAGLLAPRDGFQAVPDDVRMECPPSDRVALSRGQGEGCPILGRGLSHPDLHGMATITDHDPRLFQDCPKNPGVLPEPRCKGFQAFSIGVGSHDGPRVDLAPMCSAALGTRKGQGFLLRAEETAGSQDISEGGLGDVRLFREGDDVLSGEVALDQVLKIEVIHLRCLVYNLETVEGWYVASNLIVSNCRPPKNELSKVRSRLSKWNEGRVAKGLEPWPDPAVACKPRLDAELSKFHHVIALGGEAYQAFVGGKQGILGIRGQLHTLHDAEADWETKLLPTVHPAFVLRSQRWRQVFRLDIARAFRWFNGKLKWDNPKLLFCPSPEVLRAWLFTPRPFTVWDVETRAAFFEKPKKDKETGISAPSPRFDALYDRLNCIGFGDEQVALVVPFRSVEHGGVQKGLWNFYSESDWHKIITTIVEWAETEDIIKVGWNSLAYDTVVFAEEMLRLIGRRVRPKNQLDGMLVHRVDEPDLPHSLGFVGSLLTDVHNWKQGHAATNAKTNMELAVYNSVDDCVTAQIIPPLIKFAAEQQLLTVLESDHRMQMICTDMHRVGMPVDQPSREAKVIETTAKSAHWKSQIFAKMDALKLKPATWNTPKTKKHAEAEGWFNPGSTEQVGKLLFEVWDLPLAKDVEIKELWTETGERGTGDAVLRSYVGDPRLLPEQRDLVHALRLERRAEKTLGSFLEPMNPGWPSQVGDFTWTNGEYVRTGCVLHPDGRIHPHWNAGRTNIGRLASNTPNGQNMPEDVKAIIALMEENARRAAMGLEPLVFVGADQDALHLRIIGDLWNIPSLQEAFIGTPKFHRGVRLGPHELFAILLFGDTFLNTPHGTWPTENPKGKWTGDANAMRSVAKTVRYAGAYKGRPATLFREITATEDKETGALIFARRVLPDGTETGYTPAMAEKIHDDWHRQEPQWEIAWNTTVENFKKTGYLVEPILGRRLFCRDEKETEIINGPILLREAALMHLCTQDFAKEVPPDFAGPGTGLCNQAHDALTAIVPLSMAKKYAGILQDCMTRTLPGCSIPFIGKAKIGMTWKEV